MTDFEDRYSSIRVIRGIRISQVSENTDKNEPSLKLQIDNHGSFEMEI